MRSRSSSLLIVAVAIGWLLAFVAPAYAATPRGRPQPKPNRYAYFSAQETWVPPLESALAGVATPAGRVTPFGHLHLIPDGSAFSINIDDFGTYDDGDSIPVFVSAEQRTLFSGCVPVRRSFTITGATPGKTTNVYLSGSVENFLLGGSIGQKRCSSVPTVGVVTVRGASSEAATTG